MFFYESFRQSSSNVEEKKECDLDSIMEDPAARPAVDNILREIQTEEWYRVRKKLSLTALLFLLFVGSNVFVCGEESVFRRCRA